jgi:hypothetical protein
MTRTSVSSVGVSIGASFDDQLTTSLEEQRCDEKGIIWSDIIDFDYGTGSNE